MSDKSDRLDGLKDTTARMKELSTNLRDLKHKFRAAPRGQLKNVIRELDDLLNSSDCSVDEIEAMLIGHLEITGSHDDVTRIMRMAQQGWERMEREENVSHSLDRAHVTTLISILNVWLKEYTSHDVPVH